MELKTNFDGSTKLRDWFPMVKENFEAIAETTSELEVKANNAMTKRDVNEYFDKVLEATGTSINAVEELAAAIAEGGEDVIGALQSLSGKSLRNEIYTEQKNISEVISELSEENAILTFKAGATDSPVLPNTTPIVLLHTANTDYLLSPSTVYSKVSNGTWVDVHASTKEDVEANKVRLLNQTDVLLGKYTGNGNVTRNIDLSSYIPNGFKLVAVEVYTQYGGQFKGNDRTDRRGGLAMLNNDLKGYDDTAIRIMSNTSFRFDVEGDKSKQSGINLLNEVYYFKAYIRRTDATTNNIIEIS